MNLCTKDSLVEYAGLLAAAPKIALKAGTTLYKARSCSNADEVEKIKENPSYELLTNPMPSTREGRFHSKGEFCLYLSSSPDSARREVEDMDKKIILLGKFITNFHKVVLSLLPEDYDSCYFSEAERIKRLSVLLYDLSHKQNNYEETKKFVQILEENNVIEGVENQVFIIRYKSVKDGLGNNFFLCGAIQNEKILGSCRAGCDSGYLSFVGYEQIEIGS